MKPKGGHYQRNNCVSTVSFENFVLFVFVFGVKPKGGGYQRNHSVSTISFENFVLFGEAEKWCLYNATTASTQVSIKTLLLLHVLQVGSSAWPRIRVSSLSDISNR